MRQVDKETRQVDKQTRQLLSTTGGDFRGRK